MYQHVLQRYQNPNVAPANTGGFDWPQIGSIESGYNLTQFSPTLKFRITRFPFPKGTANLRLYLFYIFLVVIDDLLKNDLWNDQLSPALT